MELRNFYKSELTIRKDCASLILRCNNYMQLHPESKLWLRKTDHTYAPIRLEDENVPKEDYAKIMSLCPKCGSPILKSTVSNHYYEDYGFKFCDYCYAIEEEDGWTQMVRLLSYLNRIDSNTKSKISVLTAFKHKLSQFLKIEKRKKDDVELNNANRLDAERFRIRVLTSDSKLLYLTLSHIRMDMNGELYIEHDNDKSDKVKFAGVYLRERDKNGQKLYQGDIVRFEFIRDNYDKSVKWEGVLRNKKKRKEMMLFIIEDNLKNSIPPSPEWIINDTIEVIGNIFETNEIKGYNADEWIKFIFRNV